MLQGSAALAGGMKDWEEFAAQIDLLPEEVLLQHSADDLLRRLDHIGQMRGEREAAPRRPARPRRLSAGSETSSAAGGSSICSDSTDGRGGVAAAAASRLYEQRKPRQRTSGAGKENGSGTSSGSVHVPQISDRSKAMIGDRDGEVGARLHQAGQQSAARRMQAVEEARQQAAEAAERYALPPRLGLI